MQWIYCIRECFTRIKDTVRGRLPGNQLLGAYAGTLTDKESKLGITTHSRDGPIKRRMGNVLCLNPHLIGIAQNILVNSSFRWQFVFVDYCNH